MKREKVLFEHSADGALQEIMVPAAWGAFVEKESDSCWFLAVRFPEPKGEEGENWLKIKFWTPNTRIRVTYEDGEGMVAPWQG